jgi:excinuclease UvrABC ATPase subunit
MPAQPASPLDRGEPGSLETKGASWDHVRVRGARENNLKNVDVDIPRKALVVFSGISGSGKSSLAFGTLYAEAQRRYFESVSPCARRLTGGEAQRIKLANELQRAERGSGLYVLDEPSTGLHAADVDRLMGHLRALVATGNTVVIIEHDMRVAARCDWLVELGPGAGANGGRLVECGTPTEVARRGRARSAPI